MHRVLHRLFGRVQLPEAPDAVHPIKLLVTGQRWDGRPRIIPLVLEPIAVATVLTDANEPIQLTSLSWAVSIAPVEPDVPILPELAIPSPAILVKQLDV